MKLIDISTASFPNTFTMVDDADFDWLNQWKWRCQKKPHTIYVIRNHQIDGVRTTPQMHREIINPEADILIDHIDGNGLNNQRNNLRLANRFQNARNRSISRNNTSGLIGVSWASSINKWVAQIHIKNESGRHTIKLGTFSDPVKAAIKRDQAAIKYHGEFAKLNF